MDMDQVFWGDLQLDRHSPVPLYQQLTQVIAEAIRDNRLKPGNQLPSECDLITAFGVSRFVVRQTLNSLSRQGLIITAQGRGSFVTTPKITKPLDVLQSYHAAMKKAGLDVEVRILTKEIIIPHADIAENLKLKPTQKVLQLERVAYSNGAPLNLLISQIAPGTWGLAKLLSFSSGSLYQFLSTECGIHLNHSKSSIEVIYATETESHLLNLARGTGLLQILSVSYDRSGTPVEVSRVVYPATMFRYQFESHISDSVEDSKPMMIPG
jgi:GntR family transcriptional regulator